jgi:hypothetical protein
VATTPFAGGATSCGPGPSAAGEGGPRAVSTSRSTRSMLLGERGAGATANGDGEFRAPPDTGPRRVRAPEVPGAARFASPCLGAPMRRGPPAPGVHWAGTFILFLLPGGRPRRFAPELGPAAVEEAEGSMSLGSVGEEVALEGEGEVPEVSRRLYLRGAAGVVASSLSAGTEALARCSAVKRRAIMTVDASGTAASPAISSHQLRSRHVSAASASSHGPLTARLTCAVGGPNSFWGPPALRPLERARSRAGLLGATVGVLDTGVSRSTCSWASSTAQLRPRGETTTEAIGEDPHKEAPHEENDDQNR